MIISRSVYQYLSKQSFLAHVLTLMTGTMIARAIPVAISPILTRIYTPEDFGLFALFMAVTSILSAAVTGRYELAIMLPERDEAAFNLVGLTVLVTILVSFLFLLVVIFFNRFFATILGNIEIAPWLYLVPLSIFLTGIYQAFYYWTNRRKEFGVLAMNRVSQSTATGLTNLGMGFSSWGPAGLILGTILGQAVGTGFLGGHVWRRNRTEKYTLVEDTMKEQAKEYVNFPKYSVMADSINNAANQIPVVLLTSLFGSSVVGFFNLTQRVLAAPISLVATSVFDVFKQKASHDFTTSGNCREIFVKTFKNLLLISILPFAFLFSVAPDLFAFIFGESWRMSGQFARIMTVLFFLRFTASPLGYVLYIAGKQHFDLLWQIALFILTTSSIILGHYFARAEYSIGFFTISYSLMYIVYLFLSYKFAKGKSTKT